MRGFDWDKPVLGSLTATDFAEAAAGVVSMVVAFMLLSLFG